jgi:hypothetical protein
MSKRPRPHRVKAAVPVRSGATAAARAYAKDAERLLRSGKRREAAARWQRAVNADPSSATYEYQLGRLLLKLNETELGILHLEKSVKLDGTAGAPTLELAQAYTQTNRFDAARGLLDRVLASAPNAPQVHLICGTFFHKQGKLPESIDHLRTALELMLAHPETVSNPKHKDNFDRPELERLLWTTLSQLALAGVHAFAAFGTLLGMVREGHLLPFDKDVDIGLPYGELDRAEKCLLANGWVGIPHPFTMNPRSYVNMKVLVSIDVTGFVVDAASGATYEGVWIEGIPWEWNRFTRWPTLALEKTLSPHGSPIWALRDPETWLDTIYGDWHTPDPYFDSIVAAKNLCGFSLMTQCYLLGRIYERWESRNYVKALATVRHGLRHCPDDALLIKVEGRLAELAAKQSASPVAVPA